MKLRRKKSKKFSNRTVRCVWTVIKCLLLRRYVIVWNSSPRNYVEKLMRVFKRSVLLITFRLTLSSMCVCVCGKKKVRSKCKHMLCADTPEQFKKNYLNPFFPRSINAVYTYRRCAVTSFWSKIDLRASDLTLCHLGLLVPSDSLRTRRKKVKYYYCFYFNRCRAIIFLLTSLNTRRAVFRAFTTIIIIKHTLDPLRELSPARSAVLRFRESTADGGTFIRAKSPF